MRESRGPKKLVGSWYWLPTLAVLGGMAFPASMEAAVLVPAISGAPHPIVIGGSFSPKTATIRYPGGVYSGEVMWMFSNASFAPMSVTDSTGLNLYNTGPRHSPYEYDYVFKWAGSYPYHSTTNGAKGMVKVAMSRNPGLGGLGTSFALRWASATRKNCVFDVEVNKPGTTKWSYLAFATTQLSTLYRPTVTGWYAIRNRLRNTFTKKYSAFSPSVLIHVT